MAIPLNEIWLVTVDNYEDPTSYGVSVSTAENIREAGLRAFAAGVRLESFAVHFCSNEQEARAFAHALQETRNMSSDAILKAARQPT
ncbi:hypothetical protein ACLQ81_16995 [Bordetella avium]|uniref:hypothetical protein n=4 Tax=Bordetella avium TaxID=521 RepID=UPI000E20C236|nr:hypothetical protein [Bordetella avium]UOK17059.1 hypothetical protein vBBaMIFTN1_57 [Bordetella phage vB_BaM-IFTN1]UOK17458.1 hypothetical protein vBBaMIFTN7_61 [Bordetella phage vB_BaM-IFTN7]RIQ11412.1 hypothetical protein D0432_16820 [Bordetella avium]RIQ17473.1 hypothetical protein D0850_11460 [Bordetella avium]RIQ38175.1 hypothetical protein D0847_17435 [Bordetella avium]